METWIPNQDSEIIKLEGLLLKDKQAWSNRLSYTTGLYNNTEGYIISLMDNKALEFNTPVTSNRYLFNSKVTFRLPIFEVKTNLNVNNSRDVGYTIYATPRIISIVFVENRKLKQYYFKLLIKNTYDMYNPGAGTTATTYTYDLKGFKNPSVRINSVNSLEYQYQTFTFNTKEIEFTTREITFNEDIVTYPIISGTPEAITSAYNSIDPLMMGDDALTNLKSRQTDLKTRIIQFFKRKENRNGNLK